MRHTVGNTHKYSDIDPNCDVDCYVNCDSDCYVNGNCYGDVNCYGYSVGDTDEYLHTWRQRNTRAMDDRDDRTALEISSWRNN